MSIFKCKMCGGTLEITNETVATCEYCGTQQTLPKLNDETRVNLYDRANHFRRNNEFDKAMGIYEKILEDDKTDSEAYWSLVLCRYGIEYVEDPETKKRIPTVNRAQFTSVFDDNNYKSALEYADSLQRSIYEEEAKVINEIQKGILAISNKEEPFDVFICYKETDNQGRRTHDSVLANDLYHQLTQEGFKVFFARITLEDKLGTAYEPYIFAALNSAKVMVVVGTKPEFFNAVWVKNEWSRYLALIKNGAKKILIPAYKDMDPYDLPEEFSHLQAQDMSKLGFMQDLIRGIKKILVTENSKTTVVKETVVTNNNTNSTPLLKRVFMFLEDGDWDSANEYCEKVLDIEPECAEAYVGKLMAELCVKKQENLKDCDSPFDTYNNYQKAIRFGDDKLIKTLKGYINHINTRNENDRLEGIYNRANAMLSTANTDNDFIEAAQLFDSIDYYKDSAQLVEECYKNAEITRKDVILSKGKSMMRGVVISKYEQAIKIFETIPGWRDADESIVVCKNKIEQIKKDDEAKRLEREKQEAQARENRTRRVKLARKITIISVSATCLIIAFIIVLINVIIPLVKYNGAIALMNDGKYTEAISAFEDLEGYNDSAEMIIESKYKNAISLMNSGKYAEAINAFKELEGYKDSGDKLLEAKYNNAVLLMDSGDFDEAYNEFIMLNGYKDSNEKISEISERKIEKLKIAKVGDYLSFGLYEQDNNTSNGKEPIEWLVLDEKDGKKLVISKYALDCRVIAYDQWYVDITWANSVLRPWLNNNFINTAFSNEEKEMIPTVTVPGNNTKDKVFLLSVQEAYNYFSDNEARKCVPTEYAITNGAYNKDNSGCCWWLRTSVKEDSEDPSMGVGEWNFAIVDGTGVVNEEGLDLDCDFAVRPALWININK